MYNYLDPWNVITPSKVLGTGGGPGSRGAHTVTVILADESDRQIPELSHVVSLEDLALVGGAVTVKSKCNIIVTKILLGECNASADRDLMMRRRGMYNEQMETTQEPVVLSINIYSRNKNSPLLICTCAPTIPFPP